MNARSNAPENAGHLTTAFASGRPDSEAGSESQAFTVDRADRGLPLRLQDEERPNDKGRV